MFTEHEVIKIWFQNKGILLSDAKYRSVCDRNFCCFAHENKVVVFFESEPEISVLQEVVEDLKCQNKKLDCFIFRHTPESHVKDLESRGWISYSLQEMEDLMKKVKEEEAKQAKQTAALTDSFREEALKTLTDLRRDVDAASKEFIRTTPFCSYQVNGTRIEFDLRDILLMGAVAQADVLLTGKTGSGKTKLANAVMHGLFGKDGCYSKTMLPSMSPSEFMDIDFEKMKSIPGGKEDKDSSDIHELKKGKVFSGIPALEKAGIVVNEINRAPSVIQSMMIPFLDRELEYEGVPIPMGREYGTGQRYQFRILTINEGGAYDVYPIDPAIRDRMTIEVPVDAFPQSHNDVLEMLDSAGTSLDAAPDNFKNIIDLYKRLKLVPVSRECKNFLVYLTGLSYCVRAPRGNKESITVCDGLCKDCHHVNMQPFGRICPDIRAPSARIILHLQKIGRAFALFRCWKNKDAGVLQVEPQDIIEAAPFVLFSKLSLEDNWIQNQSGCHGDRWTAIRELVKWLYEDRYKATRKAGSDILPFLECTKKGETPNREILGKALNYVKQQDPWAYNPATLKSLWEFSNGQNVGE